MHFQVISTQKIENEATGRSFIQATLVAVKEKFEGEWVLQLDPNTRQVIKRSMTFFTNSAPEVGGLLVGEVKHFLTTPYEIKHPDGTSDLVEKYSCIVLDGEDPVKVANMRLQRNDACVIQNGKPTRDLKPAMSEEKV